MAKDIALRFCLNSLYRRNLNSYFSLNHLNASYPDFCLFVKKKSVKDTLLRPPSHHASNFVRTEKICTFADVEIYLHRPWQQNVISHGRSAPRLQHQPQWPLLLRQRRSRKKPKSLLPKRKNRQSRKPTKSNVSWQNLMAFTECSPARWAVTSTFATKRRR